MRRKIAICLWATSMLAVPQLASAQQNDSELLRAELEAMRAQMSEMQARLDAMQQAETQTDQSAAAVASVAPAAPTTAAGPALDSKPEPKIAWRGAPEISTADGWSFKPRGRIQLDVASLNTAGGITVNNGGGVRTEFRRVYLGVEGKIPGGFSYRVEGDFADGVKLTDVYLRYGTGPLKVTAGQIKPFWGLEEMTSDLFISFLERSSISQAFGFERRVGLSGEYSKGDILIQGGVFGANADALNDHLNKAFGGDFRAVYAPKLSENITVHLGGSVHIRDLNDDEGSVRYRARPGVHTTDVRLVNTEDIAADGERSFGLEAAIQNGPFHAAAEGYWQNVRRVDGPNPTFFGGYGEVGMVLTKGDKRSYKGGAFDRLRPSNPINKGGLGAFEINARYDYLNLNDQDIVGGRQKAAWLSLIWVPVDYVRFTANYGKMWIRDARVETPDGSRNYGADTFGLRAQVDF